MSFPENCTDRPFTDRPDIFHGSTLMGRPTIEVSRTKCRGHGYFRYLKKADLQCAQGLPRIGTGIGFEYQYFLSFPFRMICMRRNDTCILHRSLSKTWIGSSNVWTRPEHAPNLGRAQPRHSHRRGWHTRRQSVQSSDAFYCCQTSLELSPSERTSTLMRTWLRCTDKVALMGVSRIGLSCTYPCGDVRHNNQSGET